MLEELVARWGYVAIAIGAVLEGETAVIVGAALAHHGMLDARAVAITAFAGSFAGDQAWYWLGRRSGARLIASRPRWADRASRAQARMRRCGDAYVVAFRFLYGLRVVSPVLLGAAEFPARRFVPLNAIGAALWSVAITALGWSLGSAIQALLGRLARIEELIAVAAVVALVIAVATRIVRRRRAASPARDVDGATPAE
ncbi:DedA family protein [Sandaracinus amylolyticus]|uniref:DedA family inner membrane protein YohD n=1 Tax=Sandaracinus amylolyticus TaxID=927083 RepID=A0A0F6W865_9BACT|nr:DedA family protein [Sandaracinus amylolyticus]AKF09950.1 DedA family inner membrane protein YohD [Sandaracinus amylolyticus]